MRWQGLGIRGSGLGVRGEEEKTRRGEEEIQRLDAAPDERPDVNVRAASAIARKVRVKAHLNIKTLTLEFS